MASHDGWAPLDKCRILAYLTPHRFNSTFLEKRRLNFLARPLAATKWQTKLLCLLPQTQRDDLGTTFGRVFVNKRLDCLGCHNSEWSISGSGSGWNRTHPIPGQFERHLYGENNNNTPLDATDDFLEPTPSTTSGPTSWASG